MTEIPSWIENDPGPDGVPEEEKTIREMPTLPAWFWSEGLDMLRAADYAGARSYYEARIADDPEDARGWFGLGAALQGQGQVDMAVAAYVRGRERDILGQIPLQALAVEAQPGQPDALCAVAEALTSEGSEWALQCAIALYEEVMASPASDRRPYLRADTGRRKAREALRWVHAQSNPLMLAELRAEARGRFMARVLKTLVLLTLLAGLAWGGHQAYRRSQADALYKVGMLDYLDAYHMVAYNQAGRASGSSDDPYELYKKSLRQFEESARYRPTWFDVHFMIGKAGRQVLHCATGASDRSVDVKRVTDAVQKAEATCKQLDPTGEEGRRAQAALEARQAGMR